MNFDILPYQKEYKLSVIEEFPGSPVVRALPFYHRGTGLNPGWGTKIPNAVQVQLKKKGSEPI